MTCGPVDRPETDMTDNYRLVFANGFEIDFRAKSDNNATLRAKKEFKKYSAGYPSGFYAQLYVVTYNGNFHITRFSVNN